MGCIRSKNGFNVFKTLLLGKIVGFLYRLSNQRTNLPTMLTKIASCAHDSTNNGSDCSFSFIFEGILKRKVPNQLVRFLVRGPGHVTP